MKPCYGPLFSRRCDTPPRDVLGQAWLWPMLMLGCQAASPGPQKTPAALVQHATPAGVEAERKGQSVRPVNVEGSTWAPQPAAAPDPALAALLARCGPGDAALHAAAQKLLEPELAQRRLDSTHVTFAVRTAHNPYVRPRGLRLKQAEFEPEALADQLRSWLNGLGSSLLRRCGIAGQADSSQGYRLAIVAADALGELEPLPAFAAPGERVRFRANVRVAATEAQLVVLAPHGPPVPVATTLSGGLVTADFFVNQPGLHQLQLMVDHDGGPRPALEAWIGVGVPLPTRPSPEPVPGQHAVRDGEEPAAALTQMLNAARQSEGMPPLERSAELDQAAREHAQAMLRAGRMAHDLGDGSPLWRPQVTELHPRAVGENLAHAPSLEQAHRAIWLSPSHRANVLARHFDRIGIGLERDQHGDWWICQLFAEAP